MNVQPRRMSTAYSNKPTSFPVWVRLLLIAVVILGFLFFLTRAQRNSIDEQMVNEKSRRRFGLMLDAGSSGSRIHVYQFILNDAGDLDVVNEVFEQVKPGLSAYSGKPGAAAASLEPLLDVARKTVPKELWGCTAMALKATAGLRLLGEAESKDILDAVESFLKASPFHLVEGGVQIMGGSDEGVFAWTAVNFLLGRLNSKDKSPVGIMDLGGGSTQIVFLPQTSTALDKAPSEVTAKVAAHGAQYIVYQHSYLGYGLIEARRSLIRLLIRDNRVKTPCLPSTYIGTMELGANVAVPVSGTKDSSFAACYTQMKEILKLNTPCSYESCSFAGIFQPPATELSKEWYIFSFFFDRAEKLGLDANIVVDDYRITAEAVCVAGKDSKYAAAIKENPQFCLDLTFMYTLLHDGYHMQPQQKLTLAKKIRGYETGWYLGAMMSVMNDAKIECH